MKKFTFLFLVFMLVFSLTACNKESKFTFKNLRVDFSDAVSLGIAPKTKNNVTANKRTSDDLILLSEDITVNTETELVKLNDQGVLTTVEFYNNSNSVVEIPYNLFYYEVIGDFTYLLYYEGSQELILLTDEFINFSGPKYGITSFIDYTFTNYFDPRTLNVYKIIIHNESGRIFDFTAVISEYYESNTTTSGVDVQNFHTSSNGFFFKTGHYDLKNDTRDTCTNFATYNSVDLDLELDTQCSSANYEPTFGFSSDTFFYFAESKYYSTINGDFTRKRPDKLMQDLSYTRFNITNNSSGILWSDGYLEIFTHTFETIEYIDLLKEINLEREFNGEDLIGRDAISYYFLHKNRIYLSFREQFFVYDLNENKVVFIQNLWEQYEFNIISFVQDGEKLYIFDNNSIHAMDLENFSITPILQTENLAWWDSIRYFIQTGYIRYQYLEGLTQVTVYIDPLTGKTETSSINDTHKSTWSIKPIN